MNGFDRDLMDKLLRLNYHLIVESFDNTYDDISLSHLESIEGVKSASLFLQTQVFAKLDDYIVPLMVRGVDFTNDAEREELERFITWRSKDEGFFVGEQLARRVSREGEIEFYPLVKKFKTRTEKIGGFFRVGLYDIDNNYIITDLERARALGPNHLIFLGLRLDEPFRVIAIQGEVDKMLKGSYITRSWMDSNKALFSALKLEKLTMFVILTLIIIVACFTIFATLSIRVVEKIKDIGILKSLGFTSSKILSLFTLQGIFLGVIGTGLGLALGVGLCMLLKEYKFITLPQEIYYVEHLPVFMNYKDIFIIALVGVCFSFFSSLLPALRGSRLAPTEALRYE